MIWEELGYTIDRENKTLVPPNLTDPSAYRRLLRAWVELGAYTADYLRKNRTHGKCCHQGKLLTWP